MTQAQTTFALAGAGWEKNQISRTECSWHRKGWTVAETGMWIGGCLQSRWCARFKDPVTGRRGLIRSAKRRELSRWQSAHDAKRVVDRVLAGLPIGPAREVVL